MSLQGGAPLPPATITAGEQRIELQLEGLRSIMSGGFLALGNSMLRVERMLERMAASAELQHVESRKTNALLREQLERMPRHTNGSGDHDHEITEEHDHG